MDSDSSCFLTVTSPHRRGGDEKKTPRVVSRITVTRVEFPQNGSVSQRDPSLKVY